MMSTTRLSGSELYCLAQKGYQAGNLVFGNSVYSRSAILSLSASVKAAVGCELQQASKEAQQARAKAYQRMKAEVPTDDKTSICGLSCNLIYYPDYLEFTINGSLIHPLEKNKLPAFSSAANGQELYAQLDAGYQPLSFAFGNAVYASGLAQGLGSSVKSFSRGEIKELSATFEQTKNQVLERLIRQAKEKDANALIGIETSIFPFGKACEMLMTGSACYNPQLSSLTPGELITSGLKDTELWNCAKLGYVPLRLLLATSIYSLGFVGNLVFSLKSFFRGEATDLSKMMQEARRKTLAKLDLQAKALGADEIMGVKTYVYSLGNGLLEFFALGTAMKKLPQVSTESEQLPPQAFSLQETLFYNGLGDLKKDSPFAALFQILQTIHENSCHYPAVS